MHVHTSAHERNAASHDEDGPFCITVVGTPKSTVSLDWSPRFTYSDVQSTRHQILDGPLMGRFSL